MIVTCPSCNSRYKIKADKITGRGAKITCPKCSHRFVVYKDEQAESDVPKVPANVTEYDFRTFGLTWYLRRTNGDVTEFWSLQELNDRLEQQQASPDDAITFDNRDWSRIGSLDNLPLFFFQTWEKAKRGEIIIAAPEVEDDEDEDEDAADAPTTLMGHGSAASKELADLMAGLETPAAMGVREESPQAVVLDQTDQPAAPRDISNLSKNFVEPSDLPTADRPAPIDTGTPAAPRGYNPPAPTAAPPPESKQDSSPSSTLLVGIIVVLVLIIGAMAFFVLSGNDASPPLPTPTAEPANNPVEPDAPPSDAAPDEPSAPAKGD